MVSSISFGNFATIGGKQVLTGGNSGYDTQALIKSLTDARRAPAVALETKQKTYALQTSAFDDLKKLVQTFQNAADVLRGQPGILDQDKNIFDYRATTVSANGTTQSGNSYVDVTAGNGAVVQNYTISDITSLAAAKKQQTDPFTLASVNDAVVVAGATAGQFEAAQFSVKGQSITLQIGDSLQTVADKFNAVSTGTGIKASILQTTPGKYNLIFTSTTTGLASDFDLTNPSTVTDPSGALAHINISNAQPASDAVFKLDGITVQRSTNQISDLVSGLTFNIKQQSASGVSLNVGVTADVASAKTAITSFLDSYNNLRLFYAKQTARNDDGTPKSTTDASGNTVVTAVLADNSTMRGLVNTSLNEITSSVSGLGSGVFDRLSAIGVTVGDYAGDADNPATRNIMVLDDTKLTNALNSNFDQVRNLFQFSSQSTNSNLQVYKRANNLLVNSFTVNADPATNTYTATYTLAGVPTTVNLDYSAITGGGASLTGPAGSAIAGMQLTYASATAGTATVSFSQGVADQVYNNLTAALNDKSGTITNEINAIKTKNDSATTEIARIDDIVDRYRTTLLDQFSKLESALSSVNTILQTLDANSKAQAAANG